MLTKEVFQCGNIIVSGVDNKKRCLESNETSLKGTGCGFLFMETTNDGSLITLDNFCELGLHQICQVQYNVNTGKPIDITNTANKPIDITDTANNEVSDSSVLLCSNESDQSLTDNSDDMFSNAGNWDCSSANTIGESRLHNDQEDVVLTKRIYSMNDMYLSGSTVDATAI